jgi:bifunctional polynucleotide phosphatase/kinase
VLPEIAFNTFGSKFQEPTAEEGFSELIKVPFTFVGSEEEKRLWSKYWY